MRNSLVVSSLCVYLMFFPVLLAAQGDQAKTPEQRLAAALEKSRAFLLTDGVAWFDGDIEYQAEGCVSCHQVPAGLWSLSAANSALGLEPSAEEELLWSDATKFAEDPDVGRPAMWSQLLLAEALMSKWQQSSNLLIDRYQKLISDSQQDNGAWQAKGQFPSQRRPIEESDAVVTMWMLYALDSLGELPGQLQENVQRANSYVKGISGRSTEWLVFRMLVARREGSEYEALRTQLINRQNADGGWGWESGSQSDAYSTGVALFGLASDPSPGRTVSNAIIFLLDRQNPSGSWKLDGHHISKKSSESRDYIYEYWGSAWATIGLSEVLKRGSVGRLSPPTSAKAKSQIGPS